MSYLSKIRFRRTPQSLPLAGQVPNSAGGHAWAVDEWTRLHRFLVLGTEGGSFYATEATLTRENARAVQDCLERDGPRTVAEIVAVSRAGRAPKNDPALFALAMAAGLGDEPTRRAALAALPDVCRIGTHLFHFATFVEEFRGWGRALRRAVGAWYAHRTPDALASRRSSTASATASRTATCSASPTRARGELRQPGPRGLARARRGCSSGSSAAVTPPASRAGRGVRPRPGDGDPADAARSSASTACRARRCERAPQLPGGLGGAARGLPMTALIRNLATLTRVGVLAPGSDGTAHVLDRLGDAEASAGRASTRSRCSRPCAPTPTARARGARHAGSRCRRWSTRWTRPSTRRSGTSSRLARASCSRSTCRPRWRGAGRGRSGADPPGGLGGARAGHRGHRAGAPYRRVHRRGLAPLRSPPAAASTTPCGRCRACRSARRTARCPCATRSTAAWRSTRS